MFVVWCSLAAHLFDEQWNIDYVYQVADYMRFVSHRYSATVRLSACMHSLSVSVFTFHLDITSENVGKFSQFFSISLGLLFPKLAFFFEYSWTIWIEAISIFTTIFSSQIAITQLTSAIDSIPKLPFRLIVLNESINLPKRTFGKGLDDGDRINIRTTVSSSSFQYQNQFH